MDVLDTVTHYPHVQEYVIMAADADYTPLVTRLRKHMKETVVYQAKATSAAYTAACDSVIGEEEFLELLRDDTETEEVATRHSQSANAASHGVSLPSLTAPFKPISPTRVAEAVHRYFAESAPGHKALVATIGHVLRQEFGPTLSEDWLGFNRLGELLKQLCNLRVEHIENRMFAWVEGGPEAVNKHEIDSR
jgi:hypothetical protein